MPTPARVGSHRRCHRGPSRRRSRASSLHAVPSRGSTAVPLGPRIHMHTTHATRRRRQSSLRPPRLARARAGSDGAHVFGQGRPGVRAHGNILTSLVPLRSAPAGSGAPIVHVRRRLRLMPRAATRRVEVSLLNLRLGLLGKVLWYWGNLGIFGSSLGFCPIRSL